MKKILRSIILISIFQLSVYHSNAQVVCIMCFDQNDSISTGVNNLILNGGFENHNCPASTGVIGSLTSFCPNSTGYACDIVDWTCTGGGTSTYSCIYDVNINKSMIEEGLSSVYMGNFYCNACSSNPSDTSCLVTNSDCTVSGPPVGYPFNPDPTFGGATGVSIEQTVNGLTPLTTYILEFWAGGEQGMTSPGLFGLNVGFGDTLLRTRDTPPGGTGIRYLVEFRATSTSHTIRFTNWGHICTNCTELVLDDVRLYTLAELNPAIPPCAGSTPVALFTGPHHICPGTCTDFTNLSSNGLTFLWNFPGANPSVSTDINPTNICYSTPGNYSVTLIANGVSGSDTLTLNNYITVYPYPAPQGIAQNGDTLFANQGAVSYQWYQSGNLIPGATDYFYVATQSGNYNVVATDNNDCEVEAAIFDVVAGVGSSEDSRHLTIFPNPVKDQLTIEYRPLQEEQVVLSVYNVLGESVLTARRDAGAAHGLSIDVSTLAPSVYYVQTAAGTKVFRAKFVKE
jgi:hypothetical protein